MFTNSCLFSSSSEIVQVYQMQVIIGQIRHLSDKCSVLFGALEKQVIQKEFKVSLLYLKRHTQDVKTDA